MDLEARTAAVIARLGSVEGLDVFDGEPTARNDSDGRAHPYAAVYPSPGWADPAEGPLAGDPDLLDWTFQVTAAGGDQARCRRAAVRVLGVLVGWQLDPASGPVRLGYDPGPIQVDRDVAPSRCFLPLMFVAPLANTPI